LAAVVLLLWVAGLAWVGALGSAEALAEPEARTAGAMGPDPFFWFVAAATVIVLVAQIIVGVLHALHRVGTGVFLVSLGVQALLFPVGTLVAGWSFWVLHVRGLLPSRSRAAEGLRTPSDSTVR
jgi:hypothetical protein